MSRPLKLNRELLRQQLVEDFERIATRFEKASDRTRPWREDTILKKQAGELLVSAVDNGLIDAPNKVIETTKLDDPGYYGCTVERIFDHVVDLWLSKLDAHPVRPTDSLGLRRLLLSTVVHVSLIMSTDSFDHRDDAIFDLRRKPGPCVKHVQKIAINFRLRPV